MSTKKMFSNTAIVWSLIALISCLSSCSQGTIVDKIVEKTAAVANEQCPRALDRETRLDSVTHPAPNTLGSYMTLINIQKDSLAIDPAVIETHLVQVVKTNKEWESLRKLNVLFRFVYFDKNGDLALKKVITPEQYNK